MKKCLILSLFTLLAPLVGAGKGFSQANAQSRTDHINIGIGAMYEKYVDATLAYEHETKYHNAWEYFATGSVKYDDCPKCGHICDDSFWNTYSLIGCGIAYKPCISRGRNNNGNLRIGSSLNYASTSCLVTGLHLGYEHSYSLHSGFNIYWQLKCDAMINGRDALRGGIVLGIKLPNGR